MHTQFKIHPSYCDWISSGSVCSHFNCWRGKLKYIFVSSENIFSVLHLCGSFKATTTKKLSAKKNNLHDNHFQNPLNWSSYVSPNGEVLKWSQEGPEAVIIVTLWRISLWKCICPKHKSTMQVKKRLSIDCLQRRIANFCVFRLLFKQSHRFLLSKII